MKAQRGVVWFLNVSEYQPALGFPLWDEPTPFAGSDPVSKWGMLLSVTTGVFCRKGVFKCCCSLYTESQGKLGNRVCSATSAPLGDCQFLPVHLYLTEGTLADLQQSHKQSRIWGCEWLEHTGWTASLLNILLYQSWRPRCPHVHLQSPLSRSPAQQWAGGC